MVPRPYQIVGRDFLASHPRALLADEMRVGKTPQAILAADAVGATRILTLCPAVAIYQWADEWNKWGAKRAVNIFTKEPPPPCYTGVAVMSYNRAVQHCHALSFPPKWDVVIADESHFAKNPYTMTGQPVQRTHAVYARGKIGWNSNRLWALSGTPTPNHAGELWPMLRAFGAVQCSYQDFVRHYCYYDEEQGRVWGNKKQHLKELREIIAPYMLRRTRKQVAPDMPGIGYNYLHVKPGKVDLSSDTPEYVDTESRVQVALAKAPELAEEIEFQIKTAGGYKQTVVFAYHKEPMRLLADELNVGCGIRTELITGDDSSLKRKERAEQFKSGVVSVLVVQILAGGVAIDLSTARHGYFMELDYVPGNNEQAANRLISMDKSDPVTIDIVSWAGTMDDKVQRTLMRKVSTAVF